MTLVLIFLLVAGCIALVRFADAIQYVILYSYKVNEVTNTANRMFGRKMDSLISNIGIMFIIAAVIALLIEKLS